MLADEGKQGIELFHAGTVFSSRLAHLVSHDARSYYPPVGLLVGALLAGGDTRKGEAGDIALTGADL